MSYNARKMHIYCWYWTNYAAILRDSNAASRYEEDSLQNLNLTIEWKRKNSQRLIYYIEIKNLLLYYRDEYQRQCRV